MIIKVAQTGLTLDLVVWQILKTQDSLVVEATFNLNPGIARQMILALGTLITLPDPPAAQKSSKRESVRLWA
jgi:phage tail protein X